MRLTLFLAVLVSLSTAWAGNVFLGIYVEGEPVAATMNGARTVGMRVASVSPGSPADRAGIQQGDLLVKLGNTAIIDEDHLAAFLEDRKPGEKVSCALVRGGKSLRYTVVLAARADTDQPVSKFSLRWNAGVALNAQLEELTPQMRSYFGVRNGVLIKQVDAGGAAARAGLRAGDVLTAIAGDPVNSLKDVTTGLFSHSGEEKVPVTINRKGAVRKAGVSIDRAAAWTQVYDGGERVVMFGPNVDNMPVIDMNLMDTWLQTVVPDYPGMLDSEEMQVRLEELEREMEQWLKEWESR